MSAVLTTPVERAGQAQKIIELLAHGRMTRNDLIWKSGIDSKEVVAVLYALKHNACVAVSEVNHPTDGTVTQYYELTPSGKRLLPPPKKKPNGRHHVTGINGKFDPSRALTGAMGRIYEVVTRPITASDISRAANLDINNCNYQLNKMVRLGILNTELRMSAASNRTAAHYTRAMELSVRDEEEEAPIAKEPPKPLLAMYQKGDPVVEQIIAKHAPKTDTSAANALEADLDQLLQKHPLNEVMFALFVRLDTAYRDAMDFKNKVLNTAYNLTGGKPK